MQRTKRLYADIILILGLLLVLLSVFFIMRLGAAKGELVRVTVDNQLVGEYSLAEDGEYPLNGGTNLLVISSGEAFVSRADCPDKVCVHTGRISLAGERIVCLPYKLEIRVVAPDGDGGDDIL